MRQITPKSIPADSTIELLEPAAVTGFVETVVTDIQYVKMNLPRGCCALTICS